MEQRAHLYTLAGVCALPRAYLRTGNFPRAPIWRLCRNRGRYTSPATACAVYPFVYLPKANTLLRKLGDTVKPRLMEAEADLDRVLVIDEAKRELTLSDERIEKAITQNGARLMILDPIQAYMGEKTDMNRANEVRPMFRRLADVAERTGCAVILIGHFNKAAGGQSAYRGLGSIDFRAAARSVLLIGRVKREPNVRVIVHDKSSLAPEGKPVAFCLDPETGFSWIGEYDITADELLSGAGGNNATKTEQAERLILDLLADGKELASEDIVKAAAEAGISERTVQNAKRNMGGILGARRVGGQWYNFIKKKQPPEPAS